MLENPAEVFLVALNENKIVIHKEGKPSMNYR